MSWWGNFPRRPSVAEQRAKAGRALQRLQRSGRKLAPVRPEGRTIARSFWGRAWCENLESYHDYENRLPRGRSYLINGLVLDLKLEPGRISALVSGTSLYEVEVAIAPVGTARWKQIRNLCAGQIGSLIELLQGRISERVMRIITHREEGLFPKPREIEMRCSCPDWATMCKHVAAVMYGVGTRLDREPEMLFTLRKADHLQLIAQATDVGAVARRGTGRKTIAPDSVAEVFGIQLEETAAPARAPRADRAPGAKKRAKKAKKKTAVRSGSARPGSVRYSPARHPSRSSTRGTARRSRARPGSTSGDAGLAPTRSRGNPG